MQEINITNEPFQEMTIPFEDDEIILAVRFYSVVGVWGLDITFKDEIKTLGTKLSTGVLNLLGLNLPFDIVVQDNLDTGIDPFKLDDFSTGRCSLYLADREEMEDLRGYTVE